MNGEKHIKPIDKMMNVNDTKQKEKEDGEPRNGKYHLEHFTLKRWVFLNIPFESSIKNESMKKKKIKWNLPELKLDKKELK